MINNTSPPTSIGIIGFGRFGKVLAHLLNSDYTIKVYDIKPLEKSDYFFCDLQTILKEKVLFIAVPIRDFESMIETMADKIAPGTTVIDVCSVKVYPVKVMQSYFKNNIEIIATHPLFGPDSIQHAKTLNIMMSNVTAKNKTYEYWKSFFISKKINIIEMTPEEHDRQAAQSQGITHFIGRLLQAANIKKTEITTHGFQQLLAIKEQTCQDTWELFQDLQRYNPYSKETIDSLEKAFRETLNKL